MVRLPSNEKNRNWWVWEGLPNVSVELERCALQVEHIPGLEFQLDIGESPSCRVAVFLMHVSYASFFGVQQIPREGPAHCQCTCQFVFTLVVL